MKGRSSECDCRCFSDKLTPLYPGVQPNYAQHCLRDTRALHLFYQCRPYSELGGVCRTSFLWGARFRRTYYGADRLHRWSKDRQERKNGKADQLTTNNSIYGDGSSLCQQRKEANLGRAPREKDLAFVQGIRVDTV